MCVVRTSQISSKSRSQVECVVNIFYQIIACPCFTVLGFLANLFRHGFRKSIERFFYWGHFSHFEWF
jgi:hypothetical protein